MTFAPENVFKATRLIMFAMTPKTRPPANPEYGALVNEYLTNTEMQSAMREVARAMQVEIRVEGSILASHGPILIVSPGSVFQPNISDFRSGLNVRERVAHGILFFVIAGYAYPTAEALADDVASVGPGFHLADLVAFGVRVCESLAQAHPGAAHLEEKFMRGLEHLLTFRATARGGGERRNLESMVEWILESYVKQGLFIREERGQDVLYYPRPHYRIQVRLMVRESSSALKGIYETSGKAR